MSLSTSSPLPSSTATPPSSPYPSIPVPDLDSTSCRLLGPFAIIVQLVMGLLVIASLIYKRHKERPKRKWKIWILDITKQMLGQLFVHILNLAFSEGGNRYDNHEAGTGNDSKGEGQNPCSLYFLNVLIDTTLGVFIIYTLLSLCTHVLTDILHQPGFVSGQYTDTPTSRRGRSARPRVSYWFKQLSIYLFVLLLMKLFVLVILAIFPFLIDMGSALLALFGKHKDAQVLFSMALFPLAMNILQFWLIDSLLRHNPTTSKYAQVPSTESRPSSSAPAPSTTVAGRRGAPQDPEDPDTPPRSPLSRSRSPRRYHDTSVSDHEAPTHLLGHDSDDDSATAPKAGMQSPTTSQGYAYPPPTSRPSSPSRTDANSSTGYGSNALSPPLQPRRPAEGQAEVEELRIGSVPVRMERGDSLSLKTRSSRDGVADKDR